MPRALRVAALVLISWLFNACGVHDDQSGRPKQITDASTTVASMGPKSDGTAEILLFNGTGSSPNDVRAF